MAVNGDGMIESRIFESLQRKIDDDSAVKDALRDIVQELEKQGKEDALFFVCSTDSYRSDNAVHTLKSSLHRIRRPYVSQPCSQQWRLTANTEVAVPSVVSSAQANIDKEVQTIHKLSETASKEPYYKFNYAWTRQIQDACSSILLCGWLGGFGKGEAGQLLTIEDVGQVMGVPVNLKDRDAFHLTIEEYLQALISLLDELARLARNCVTLGDYRRPQLIAQFIKEVHAGFQILNLKNDTLRKRSDGIKYRVKEVEDVVYDLR
ncbi:Translin-1 [Friedmanniomyces endolithicus]|uniref:Translin-1 n=1 Tax=Friedmanniomyces endolithicus TaxID=329885 RepID=A0AAN6FFK1_9PEZI|nr:Translin-1 [Friedmanniomyces endolithicus]KAK0295318.1 Translin-1 [Friedmanniomyces endolithicus]KAK0317530.1 Translin-1 [Friedmanniomyces endolithicus]KAK0983172.1 Translin-1 [Friedmanniomyces endolithicus]